MHSPLQCAYIYIHTHSLIISQADCRTLICQAFFVPHFSSPLSGLPDLHPLAGVSCSLPALQAALASGPGRCSSIIKAAGQRFVFPVPYSTGHGSTEGLPQTCSQASPVPVPAGLCQLTPVPGGGHHAPLPLLSLCHAKTHRRLFQ